MVMTQGNLHFSFTVSLLTSFKLCVSVCCVVLCEHQVQTQSPVDTCHHFTKKTLVRLVTEGIRVLQWNQRHQVSEDFCNIPDLTKPHSKLRTCYSSSYLHHYFRLCNMAVRPESDEHIHQHATGQQEHPRSVAPPASTDHPRANRLVCQIRTPLVASLEL